MFSNMWLSKLGSYIYVLNASIRSDHKIVCAVLTGMVIGMVVYISQ